MQYIRAHGLLETTCSRLNMALVELHKRFYNFCTFMAFNCYITDVIAGQAREGVLKVNEECLFFSELDFYS